MKWRKVQVTFERNPAFLREVRERGVGIMEYFTGRIAEKAKKNVAPGVGPGPHPHRTPHEDSGTLMRNIKTATTATGDLVNGAVYTDVDYGLYLEIGWHAKNGAFYKYPWLLPAVQDETPLMFLQAVLRYRF